MDENYEITMSWDMNFRRYECVLWFWPKEEHDVYAPPWCTQNYRISGTVRVHVNTGD